MPRNVVVFHLHASQRPRSGQAIPGFSPTYPHQRDARLMQGTSAPASKKPPPALSRPANATLQVPSRRRHCSIDASVARHQQMAPYGDDAADPPRPRAESKTRCAGPAREIHRVLGEILRREDSRHGAAYRLPETTAAGVPDQRRGDILLERASAPYARFEVLLEARVVSHFPGMMVFLSSVPVRTWMIPGPGSSARAFRRFLEMPGPPPPAPRLRVSVLLSPVETSLRRISPAICTALFRWY